MLTTLRNKSGSIVVKFLLVLLAISFGAWGIGDYVTGRSSGGAVAMVGDTEITPQAFVREYRREYARLRQFFGDGLTPEAARSFGIPETVVQRMVRDELLNQAADQAGILPADGDVISTLQGMDQFKGLTGEFDRQVFAETLARAGYTEAAFVDLVRGELSRKSLLSGLMDQPVVADALSRRLYAFEAEQRDAVVAVVPSHAIPVAAVPDETAVAAYYQENKDRFLAPAYRRVTVLEVGPEAVLDDVSVSDDDVVTVYEARSHEFSSPASRNVKQMVFDSQDTAQAARARLDEGADFAAVASELAGLSAADTELGWVVESDLLDEVVGPVFSAMADDIIGPVESVLGWHVFLIADAQDTETTPLSDVRDRLIADLKRDRAVDLVFDLANEVDERLGTGVQLEDVGEELDLKVVTLDAVDASGRDMDGAPAGGPADPAFAAAVFGENVGVPSTLIEIENGYYAFRVDDEMPERQRDLEEVRADIVAALMARSRTENARIVAEELAGQGLTQAAFEDAAAGLGAEPTLWRGILRDGEGIDDARMFAGLIGSVFGASVRETVVAPVGDSFAAALVLNVTTPDPGANAEALAGVDSKVSEELRTDLEDLLIRGLSVRIGTSIDAVAIENSVY